MGSTGPGFLEKRVRKLIRARQDATEKVAVQLRLQTSPTMAKDPNGDETCSLVKAPKVPRTCIAIPLTSCPPLHLAERPSHLPSTLPPSIQAAFKQARDTGFKRVEISPDEDLERLLRFKQDSQEGEETAKNESPAISKSDDQEAVQLEHCNDSTDIGDSRDSTTDDSEGIQPEKVENVQETDDSSESEVPESPANQAEPYEEALETDDSSDQEWECQTSVRITSGHNKSQNRRRKIFERPQELDSLISTWKQGSEGCADDSQV
ncbi:uncharacterized protein MYCFIDRAFT_196494 [Pseudocercospora fijiensis CIRAD86]|uniref:Uncharacterized protein n=1 Tax=Pseudocercospora fijiensis (strain CIRAD86) TaxID=383855 RepID=M3B164_PSEFD|nr:uncharacterized protein MYCFIDRAFT_196494 [Pseudocercospora fijiensis CIRAD86]EME83128.1 hypothetical protein MYCFIDRAFT_196494 [Pseudocercospora fijiensis CIRAD86]